MHRFDSARIRRYYDSNTSAFVGLGQGGDVGAIHRAVWGPGVTERTQAFRYVEDQIAALVRSLPEGTGARHVVDLGCGVGGSLCYLAQQLPIRGTGITLSPAQMVVAEQRIQQLGLSDRVVCVEGDYCNLPLDLAPADVAFAIESFVHGPDPARFFAQCAALVRPGGALVLCDDFRRPGGGAAASKTIERFCRGWHINTLLTGDEVQQLAHAAGFAHESTMDLSPYLELRRPRDRAIAALLAPAAWLPWRWTRLDPLLGGTALQTCLANGWLGYDVMVFRRTR